MPSATTASSVSDYRSLPFAEWCRVVLAVTFTPAQLSIVRVLGGGDPEPGDLWGFVGPIERTCRAVVALLLGRGSGKTTISACYALWRAFTADVSMATFDVPRVGIVAPTDDHAKLVFGTALKLITKSPILLECLNASGVTDQSGNALKRKGMAVTERQIRIVRPHDGREVVIATMSRSHDGMSLRGFTWLALILDEAQQFGTDEGGKFATDTMHVDAAMPRLVRDGMILMISTPADPASYMQKHVERNLKQPKDGLAVIAPSDVMRPDDANLLEAMARQMTLNPETAEREYRCILRAVKGAYFDGLVIDTCTNATPHITRARCIGALDLAFLHDGAGLVIVEHQGDRIVQVFEKLVMPPQDGTMLSPSELRTDFGDHLLASSTRLAVSDVHEWASSAEALAARGIALTRSQPDAPLVRSLLRSGSLTVLPQTARQLRTVTASASGAAALPRGPHGHADLVAALLGAVALACKVHGQPGRPAQLSPSTLPSSHTY